MRKSAKTLTARKRALTRPPSTHDPSSRPSATSETAKRPWQPFSSKQAPSLPVETKRNNQNLSLAAAFLDKMVITKAAHSLAAQIPEAAYLGRNQRMEEAYLARVLANLGFSLIIILLAVFLAIVSQAVCLAPLPHRPVVFSAIKLKMEKPKQVDCSGKVRMETIKHLADFLLILLYFQ